MKELNGGEVKSFFITIIAPVPPFAAHVHLLENNFDEKADAKKDRSKATVLAKRRAIERRKQQREAFDKSQGDRKRAKKPQ